MLFVCPEFVQRPALNFCINIILLIVYKSIAPYRLVKVKRNKMNNYI